MPSGDDAEANAGAEAITAALESMNILRLNMNRTPVF
jgi:hypothetical protein